MQAKKMELFGQKTDFLVKKRKNRAKYLPMSKNGCTFALAIR